ncbi:hypothetical protein JHK87_040259 [Glycine soja]|nr:hypothetical protein JHK87_040259 [Glycine soja]
MIEVLNRDQGVVNDNSVSVKGGWRDLLQQRSTIDSRFHRCRRGSNRASFEMRVTGSSVAQKRNNLELRDGHISDNFVMVYQKKMKDMSSGTKHMCI